MKALDKFKKMYAELPVKARTELVLNAYNIHAATLDVVWLEASQKTKEGKKMLKQLGYEND